MSLPARGYGSRERHLLGGTFTFTCVVALRFHVHIGRSIAGDSKRVMSVKLARNSFVSSLVAKGCTILLKLILQRHSCQPSRIFGPCPGGVPVEAKYQQCPGIYAHLALSLAWLATAVPNVSSLVLCDTHNAVLRQFLAVKLRLN